MTEHRAEDDPWDAAKRLIMRTGSNPLADLGAIISHPRLLAGGLAGRLLRGKGVQHKLQRLVLDCIVEQEPNPDSRVTLSERTDNLGMPLSRIDWRITDREKATIVRLGHAIATEFKRLGLPAPRLTDWIREGRLDAADFYDAAHPSGTTRMATTPDKGVVDTNCAVHGVAGLFVAGSSVFPTSGHVNPTLSVVALSIRLADFLKTRYASPGVHQGAREKTLEKL
jgi:choline dehydrogenase-like flavoprotein